MAKQDKDATFVGDSRISAKRIPNIAPSYSDFPGKSEPFWPNFLLKEWMVAAVCLVGFLVLTVSHPSPLTDLANPNDTSFIPLPDWYFLFLYQLLKYPWAAGDWVVLGTVVIPGIAFGALMLAPWLDTGKDRRPSRRPVATGLMLTALVGIFYLTWAADHEHSLNHASSKGGSGGHGGGSGAAAPAAPADPSFKPDPLWTAQTGCMGCHGKNMEGALGPNLQKIGSQLDAAQIAEVIKNGKGQMPGGLIQDEAEIQKLAEYLASLK
ncbi:MULTISPECIES: menaquinol-cytochrome c reductase cytochrome b/c subunit [Brevibacillus]|jgi:menaquinol-cytochrome c reductase cytochrome b/c subunit|uniref:Menaquinol-cytochrome c reductase cytochrome b/c subunit n=1 Tax=Brevibacillus borstelensis AK1 TaxID=1300222 RepID=M8DJ22_9BACL|nr:menaquinol-cytochrome c reductase cytochrome b/c subunit [Brevibacillus borstelensis]EMT53568.1 menaquinol-cytochrome c reductase cytochrome b/c subunit [Brevibacillus borstelensis AK1]KKX53051.1 cytochrome Cbb3 [Brevibacillus borstelensis cifa_chp40]MBE5397824.1 c-type cytochrome [Brevibacillus borstelensis]MCC0562761.1 c-type cytochrome [Brevibacillus borstelensis]MCM3469462.1 c-type cytochrome [Brevibacillus borstelensis]